MFWDKNADDLAKSLITSAENKDVSVIKKKNITGAKAKRERRVLLDCAINAVFLFLLDIGWSLRLCQQSF